MGEGQLRIRTQLPPMQFKYKRDTNTCTYRLSLVHPNHETVLEAQVQHKVGSLTRRNNSNLHATRVSRTAALALHARTHPCKTTKCLHMNLSPTACLSPSRTHAQSLSHYGRLKPMSCQRIVLFNYSSLYQPSPIYLDLPSVSAAYGGLNIPEPLDVVYM